MKTSILALLFSLCIAPSLALAQVSLVHGSAAISTLEHLSEDGCVHTVAELVLVSGRGGELANGVYITGSQEDVCLGTGMGFATFAEATPNLLPLIYAHYTGTVVAPSYSGGDPVTFEVDLTWRGSGKVSRERNVWHDEGGLSFTSSARREAKTSGQVLADGVPLTVTSAALVSEINGTITR